MFWGGEGGSGPHFPRKCCKILVFYTVWEPATYTKADGPDELDEPDSRKIGHSGQLGPQVLRA